MPRKIVLVIILLFITYTLCADVTTDNTTDSVDENRSIKYTLDFCADYSPFFYESNYTLYSFLLRFNIYNGLFIKNFFGVGVTAYIDYFSFTGQNPGNMLLGTIFNAKATLDFRFYVKNIAIFKLGIGGLMFKDAFDYNDQGWISRFNYGMSLVFNTAFFIPSFSYIDFEILNKIELLDIFNFTAEEYSITPFYLGGVRVNFHPYIPWISLYIEASGLAMHIDNDAFTLTTGMFIASVGVAANFELPDHRFNKFAKKIKERNKVEKKETVDEDIERLRRAKLGDKVAFTTIVFNDDNDVPDMKSIDLLNKIAKFLKKNPDYSFRLYGYSLKYGDPIREQELAYTRAKNIQKHFYKAGIPKDQVKISRKAFIIRKSVSDIFQSIIIFERIAE